MCRHRPIFPGSYPPSIFSTDELNFRVRDGNGWDLIVIGTGNCVYAPYVAFNAIKMLAHFLCAYGALHIAFHFITKLKLLALRRLITLQPYIKKLSLF